MKAKKEKTKQELKRSRIYIFLTLCLGTIIIGGLIIYQIAFYERPTTQPLTTVGVMLACMIILSLGLSISFMAHGFHPILLIKASRSTNVKNRYSKDILL